MQELVHAVSIRESGACNSCLYTHCRHTLARSNHEARQTGSQVLLIELHSHAFLETQMCKLDLMKPNVTYQHPSGLRLPC